MRGDFDQVQQIILNLVTNALNATPRGGRVDVAVSSDHGGCVRLSVADSGSGVAPEHLGHLFEPFFTTRSDGGGTGLGLAIVKALVAEHGATVRVDRSPSGGALFVVDFPLTTEFPEAAAR